MHDGDINTLLERLQVFEDGVLVQGSWEPNTSWIVQNTESGFIKMKHVSCCLTFDPNTFRESRERKHKMRDKVEKTREKGTTEGSIRRQEEIN